MVDDHEQALLHPLRRPLRTQVVEHQKVRVLDGVHPLVQVAPRIVVRPANVVQQLRHRHEERGHPLGLYDLVHHRDGKVGLPGTYAAAEVQPLAGLLVLPPIIDVVVRLGPRPAGGVARVDLEVGQGVALHALGQAAALPEGRHAGVAARDLPLALVVLLLALGGAGMIVPLAVFAVLLLEGRRKLDPLGLELPAAVRADPVVEPQRLGLFTLPTRRRATHSLPGVGQQTVDPLHPSPPLRFWTPLSSAPRRAPLRSARPAGACGPSRSARRPPWSSRPARPTARGCSARSPPAARRARSRSSKPRAPRPARARPSRNTRSGTPGCAAPAETP